jgi:dihydroflavonol-4-reductase
VICKCAAMQICVFFRFAGCRSSLIYKHLHIRAFAYPHIYLHICAHLYINMILVTGATGFLGSEVAKQLADGGHPVRCIKRASSVIPKLLQPYQQIEWVEADILDVFALEDVLQGITQVFHCAAWVSLKQADKEPMINANVAGTANLVNLCVQYNIKLVHVSSIAAIGQAKRGELITENDHLDVSTEDDGYAISKLESEMEVWRGIAEGLNAVIVNPSLIIGANAGTLGSGQLFETVRKGLIVYTEGTAGFVDVEDVAKCMIALMESDITAERYIINAENRNYKQLTAEIAKGFGKTPPAIQAKPWMMELAWRVAAAAAFITRGEPVLDKVAAKASTQVRNFDNSKIKQAIGIEFKPVSETIAEVCKRLAK